MNATYNITFACNFETGKLMKYMASENYRMYDIIASTLNVCHVSWNSFVCFRHKELAPQRYMALEQKIRSDARLGEYF